MNKTDRLIFKIGKKLGPPPDLTNREVCNRFAFKYGKAIAPELRRVDLHVARSRGRGFITVIR